MMTELETTKTMKKRISVRQPCEDDSIDAADYQRKFIAAVQQARESIKRGEVYTLEEIKKEIPSWIIR